MFYESDSCFHLLLRFHQVESIRWNFLLFSMIPALYQYKCLSRALGNAGIQKAENLRVPSPPPITTIGTQWETQSTTLANQSQAMSANKPNKFNCGGRDRLIGTGAGVGCELLALGYRYRISCPGYRHPKYTRVHSGQLTRPTIT